MMNRNHIIMYLFGAINIVYIMVVGAVYSEFIFSILFYFGWGALLACFGYCLGLEHGESVKLPESANKTEEETA